MSINKQKLAHYFQHKLPDEAEQKISEQAEGPGRFDSWLFAEDRNGWEQIEPAVQVNKKRKLIFAHPLLGIRPPTSAELALFARLIEYYDVYLWPGPDTRFKDSRPITDSAEFWQKRQTAKAATQADIMKSLAEQHLSAEDVSVLDYDGYEKLFEQVVKSEEQYKFNPLDIFDFNVLKKAGPDILEMVHRSPIKKIKIPPLSEEEFLLFKKTFPYIEEIEIEKATPEWVNQFLPRLNVSKVTLTEMLGSLIKHTKVTAQGISTSLTNAVTITVPPGLKDLTIATASSVDSVVIEGGGTLQKVQVVGSNIKACNLTSLSALTSLELSASTFKLNNLTLPKKAPLKTIDIYADSLSSLDVKPFKELTNLKIKKSSLLGETVDIELDHPQLTELIIDGKIFGSVNFISHSPLKTCELPEYMEAKNYDKSNLIAKKIDTSTLCIRNDKTSTPLDSIGLSLFPARLKNLEIISCDDVTTLKDWPITEIQCLKLLGNAHLANLDLSTINGLEALEIRSNTELKEIKGLPSSVRTLKLSYLNLREQRLVGVREFDEIIIDGNPIRIDAPDTSIKRLHLSCAALTNLESFLNVKNIEELHLEYCNSLTQLSLPSHLGIKRLHISHCASLNEIDLSKFPNLEELIINGENVISEIKGNLPYLKKLDISTHTNRTLSSINLTGCPEIESLTLGLSNSSERGVNVNLSNAKKIKTTTIHGKINTLSGLTSCQNLQSISIKSSFNEKELLDVQNQVKRELPALSQGSVDITSTLTVKSTRKASLEVKEGGLNISKDIEEKERALNLRNQQSRTARFSLPTAYDVDQKTGGLDSYIARGDFEAELYDKKGGALPAQHRLWIHDQVSFDKNKISFPLAEPIASKELKIESKFADDEKIDAQLIEKMKKEIDKNDDCELGYLQGDLQKNVLYRLPVSQQLTGEKGEMLNFHCDPKNAVKLFWDDKNKQYLFKLNAKSPQVKILYQVKKNASYDKSYFQKLVEGYLLTVDKKPDTLLPKKLKEKLLAEIANYEPLQFLLKSELSSERKIELLLDYFNKINFQVKDISATETLDDFQTMWHIIQHRVGVCRHRAEAFMLLARLIGVPARMVTNSVHVFCEIPSSNKSGLEWTRCDFGGGERLNLTPDLTSHFAVSSSSSSTAPTKVPDTSISTSSSSKDLIKEKEDAIEKYYDELYRETVEENKISSITTLMESKENFAPLIRLSPNQTPLQVHGQIVQQLREQKFDIDNQFLYIHRPSDFSAYLFPKIIGEEKKEEESPLQKIIRAGGVIVINWNNFTPEEIVRYKSILDAKPTILNKPVSENVKVIGLINNTGSDTAFLSRCKIYSFEQKVEKLEIKDEKKEVKDEKRDLMMTVDLFHLSSWRVDLYGKVKYGETSTSIDPGILIKAMETGSTLVIQNPPVSEDFQLLLHRLQHEKRIFLNGRWIKTRPGFSVKLEEKTHTDILEIAKGRVTIVQDKTEKKLTIEGKEEEKPLLERQRIYLGLHNFFDCFSQLVIEKGKPVTHPGFLEMFRPETDTFYITQSIPQDYWEKLVEQMNLLGKTFHFTLAPGVKIGNIAFNQNKLESIPLKLDDKVTDFPSVIHSNDPDFFCQQVIKKDRDVLIIDVTPQTQFSDLLAKIAVSYPTSQCDYKGLFRALIEEKRTVILNGELSPFLQQQLLPLLQPKPQISVNGRTTTAAPGRLLYVTSSMPNMPIASAKTHYTYDDYRANFPGETGKLEKIFAFYEAVKLLPHRGVGRPDLHPLSCQRIRNMLAALNARHPLHVNNPVKGLFIYDYPRHSEEYAYLNVIAKKFFSPTGGKARRDKKLRQWIMRFNLNSQEKLREHSWRLLNFFSADEIRRILDERSLEKTAGFPTLTPEAFQRLIDAIRAPYIEPRPSITARVPEEKKPILPLSKPVRQFHSLLADPSKRLIILKGAAGAGKSHAVKLLENDSSIALFKGEDNIIRWLEDRSDKPKILTLDEANMAIPGHWNFLKGLVYGQNQIYYNGKVYPITPLHRVITTGNPESYANRYYHQLFQDYGETIYFKPPSHEEYIQLILLPVLGPRRLDKYMEYLLSASDLIVQYNPHIEMSHREMKNVLWRFLLLVGKKTDDILIKQALLQACMSEFAGSICVPAKRLEFEKKLEEKIGVTKPEGKAEASRMFAVTDTHFLPHERLSLVDAIEQDLKMRALSIAEAKAENRPYYKPITLIEGPPGVGKSTLFLKLMEKHHIKDAAVDKDAPHKYHFVVAGTPNAKEIIERAYHDGEIVILEEPNADKTLEKFILSLEDIAPAKPGFLLLASQNASTEAGRTETSEALRSRAHYLYVDALSHPELLAFAEHKQIPRPETFVKKYQEYSQKYPAVNPRKFYQNLYKVDIKEENRAPSPIISDNKTSAPIVSGNKTSSFDLLANHLTKKMAEYQNRPNKKLTLKKRKSIKKIMDIIHYLNLKTTTLSSEEKLEQLINSVNGEIKQQNDTSKYFGLYKKGKSKLVILYEEALKTVKPASTFRQSI